MKLSEGFNFSHSFLYVAVGSKEKEKKRKKYIKKEKQRKTHTRRTEYVCTRDSKAPRWRSWRDSRGASKDLDIWRHEVASVGEGNEGHNYEAGSSYYSG